MALGPSHPSPSLFLFLFFFLFHKRIHQAGLARGHCLMQVISAGQQHGGAGSGLYSIFAHIVDLDGEKGMFMQRFTPFWEHRSSNAGVECSYLCIFPMDDIIQYRKFVLWITN